MNNKEKIEKMIEDLLAKMHQNIANGNTSNVNDIDLLSKLEDMFRFRLKYEKQ